MPIHETESFGQREAERWRLVERAFATMERQGNIVSPFAQALYERYIFGELTLSQVCYQIDQRAIQVLAETRAAFGWVK